MFKKKITNKTFDYVPRFYDQEKEERELRLGINKKDGDALSNTKNNIRMGLRRKSRGQTSSARKSSAQSNIRLMGIIFVLFLVTYVVLKSDMFFKFADSLLG